MKLWTHLIKSGSFEKFAVFVIGTGPFSWILRTARTIIEVIAKHRNNMVDPINILVPDNLYTGLLIRTLSGSKNCLQFPISAHFVFSLTLESMNGRKFSNIEM